MRSDEHLTGRTRYRTERRLFRCDVLVLQVEVRFEDGPPDFNGLPVYMQGSCWRDATTVDLQLINRFNRDVV